MENTCTNCGIGFEFNADDLALLDKVSPMVKDTKYPLTPPSLCSSCRQQRRWAVRNERHLYKRKCDFSGKEMITLYSPNNPHTAYQEEVWWSDQWDALSYGLDVDFSTPFFDQFHALRLVVPRRGMQQDGTAENSDYSTFGFGNKNCYLIFACFMCEDVYYSSWSMAKNAIDCHLCLKGELLYDCMDCKNCYQCIGCHNCIGCHDSWFLEDCHNCHHCIGCKNLRNKEYHIYNKSVSKEEFETYQASLRRDANFRSEQQRFAKWRLTMPTCYSHIVQSENSTGNFLEQAKNCHNCFDILLGAQDCRHCQSSGWKGKDMMDCSMSGKESELLYEMHATITSQRCGFTAFCKLCENVYYCDSINNCSQCFGCIGLKHKKFCILNKQYSEEEYNQLLPQIIAHMERNREWGENFPISISPFAYNETLAQEHFTIDKQQAVEKGWKWRDPDPQDYRSQTYRPPEDIDAVSDSITREILSCTDCQRNFKIIPQELAFYRRMGVPVPDRCHECRHQCLVRLRTPTRLWDRVCGKCGKAIQTAFPPERREMIYCEECYLKELY